MNTIKLIPKALKGSKARWQKDSKGWKNLATGLYAKYYGRQIGHIFGFKTGGKLIQKHKTGGILKFGVGGRNNLRVKIPGLIFAGLNDWRNIGKEMADNMRNRQTSNKALNNAMNLGRLHTLRLASNANQTISNRKKFKSNPAKNRVSDFLSLLAALGFLNSNEIDGAWGPKTLAAWEAALLAGFENNNGQLLKYTPSGNNTDSTNTGLKAIMDHKVRYNVTDPYLFVDKKNNTATLYQQTTPLRTWEISLGGGNPSDAYTTPGWKYYSTLGNRATGAGIFTIRRASPHSHYGILTNGSRASSTGWNGEPIYWMKTETGAPVSNAIHGPASAKRASVFNNGNPNDNRVSYGCISLPDGSLYDVYNNKLLLTGDTVYINPEMKGNYIYELNGKLKTKLPNKSGAPKTFSAFNESK